METINFIHVGDVSDNEPYGRKIGIYRETDNANDHYMLIFKNREKAWEVTYIHVRGDIAAAVKRAKQFIETGK